MANLSSWFSKSSDGRRRRISDSRHELPLWRDPSPMTASIIPPPIVQSTYPTSPKAPIKSAILERPTPLDDRQRDIEADLQFLLDTQAAELERGRRGEIADDQTSTGSTTPTAQSIYSAAAKRTPRPVQRKLGLRGARRGIYSSILALSAVKDEELHIVDAEVHAKDKALAQIDGWEKKRQGLQEARNTVDENEDTVRVQRLKQEADALQQEINHVEMQLSDLKGRQRKLLRKAASVENAVQAKLATYTSSLSLLESDVQKFLSSTPQDEDVYAPAPNGESVWQLPPKRRTLEMARAQYVQDREAVIEERGEIERESRALREGATMWKEVVTQVGDFEKRMRAEMSNVTNAQEGNESASEQRDLSTGLQQLLDHLQLVLESIEAKFRTAEKNDWRLLIAAIGAELDAFRQGKTILEGLLGIQSPKSDLVDADDVDEEKHAGQHDRNGGAEIHELDKSFETTRPTLRRMDSNTTDDTDNDPDPELLFSRQDVEHDDH